MFIFGLISGWWYIPDLRVFFFVCVCRALDLRALCFDIRNPCCSHICDQPSGIWDGLLCYYFYLWLVNFATAQQKKARGACVFFERGEEETTVLQTPCLKADKLQQVPNRWQKVAKLAAGSAPLSSNMTSEERWLHLINSLDFWSSKHNWLDLVMNVN